MTRCLVLFSLLVLLSVCTVAVLGLDACAPNCDGKNPGDKVEDPTNCTKYYYCLADGMAADKPVDCADGEHFDPDTNDCGPGTDCEPSCKPGSCKLTCNGTLDLIQDPTDCSNYYICLPSNTGIDGPHSCGTDHPYFDGEHCVDDPSKCCKDFCTPFCPTEGVQVPDPNDCRKFFICTESGVPTEDTHFSCDPGQVFDVSSGRCATGSTCENLCTATGGGGTTAPGVVTTAHPTTPSAPTTAGPTTAGPTTAGPTTAGPTTAGPTTAGPTTAGPTTAGPTTPVITTQPTTLEPTTGECLSSLTCTASGYISMCHTTCQQEYFICSASGQPATIGKCTGNLVFNPDPSYPYCILPDNCPYHPPL